MLSIEVIRVDVKHFMFVEFRKTRLEWGIRLNLTRLENA